MADYSRAEVTVSYGATSALQEPDFEKIFTSTPSSPTKYKHLRFSAATGGTTVDLSEFTTIEELYLKNHDTTNYVIGTYRELGDASAANRTCYLIAGQWAKLTKVTAANDIAIVANTAACVCELIAIGT